MYWAGDTSEFITSVWLFDNPVEPGDGWLSVEGRPPEREGIAGLSKKGMDSVLITNVIDSILHGVQGAGDALRPTEFISGEIDRVARLAGIEPVGPKAAQVLSQILSRSLRLAQKVYDFSVPGKTLTETIAPAIVIDQKYSKPIRKARQEADRSLPVQTFARTPGMNRARLITPWSDVADAISNLVLPLGKWQTTRASVSDLESLAEIESFATVVAIRAIGSTVPDIIAKTIPELASGQTVWVPASAAAWIASMCGIEIEEAKRSEAGLLWADDDAIAIPQLGKIASCTISADVVVGAHIDAIWTGLSPGANNTIVRWWLMWAVRHWMLATAVQLQDHGWVITDVGVGSIGVAGNESQMDDLTYAAVASGLIYQHKGVKSPMSNVPDKVAPAGKINSTNSVHVAQIRAASGTAYPAVAMELDRSNEMQTEAERKQQVMQIIGKVQDGADDFKLE
ncbi:hypothetical protein [Alcanivorax sp. 1008]|uniref:hypothetical protein n=1 Tax=Alcanivorax sp. 1008 TaxID=2816853 RepID=UPI001D98C38D|nr:hypothetical protein [Alcanivorax sp. 1008]MCC1496710.1 hypothetical protein [Alcanivorax sp. 1008]